jgi:ABC-type transporter Mla MlaB component
VTVQIKPVKDGFQLAGAFVADDVPALRKLLPNERGAPRPVLRFYCKDLTNVSSAAVPEWVDLAREAKANGTAVTLAEASSSLLDVANIYEEMLRDVRVESSHLPVECAQCGARQELLVPTAAALSGAAVAAACAACGGDMVAMVEPEVFFACLRATQAP